MASFEIDLQDLHLYRETEKNENALVRRGQDRVDGRAPRCRLYSSVFEPRCGQEICYFTRPSRLTLGGSHSLM